MSKAIRAAKCIATACYGQLYPCKLRFCGIMNLLWVAIPDSPQLILYKGDCSNAIFNSGHFM